MACGGGEVSNGPSDEERCMEEEKGKMPGGDE